VTVRGLILIMGLVVAFSTGANAQDRLTRQPRQPIRQPIGQPTPQGQMYQNQMYQNSQFAPRDGFFDPRRRRRTMQQDSWTYIERIEPRIVKLHDIITIIVSEKSEVTSNSRFNRTQQSTLKAQLNEFIRIGKTGNLRPAAEDSQPTVDANSNGRFSGTGQQTDQEGITYRIAATVVDVRPNGNIVLEARKTIQTNRDVWSYSLTGVLRSADIQANNTALSENLYNPTIKRMKTGKVNDAAKVPWGSRLVDIIFPF